MPHGVSNKDKQNITMKSYILWINNCFLFGSPDVDYNKVVLP